MNPTLFLICFFVYVLAMILFGWWITRKPQSGDDFLLGGRKLPFFLTLGTTLATMVGTGSSMGAVGKAYSAGWIGSLYGIGGAIGIIIAAWIFAPVRKFRFMTMAEELSSYVGASRMVSNLVAVFTYLACVGWLGAHIKGGGAYFQFVTGIDPTIAMVSIAAGFGIYSMIGGYKAVVWTDTIQAVVLFIGFLLTAVFAWISVGGFTGLQEVNQILTQNSGGFGLGSVSLIVAIAVGVLGTPAFRQRIYSGNSVGEIRKAFVTSGLLYLVFAALPAVIGMAAYKANSELLQDQSFPWMATEMLPVALGVITLLAGLSATMSSASSDAIAGVTTVIRDLYRMIYGCVPPSKHVVLYSRFALAATTVVALMMAMSADNILDYIKNMIGLFLTGMCVCGLLGRCWDRFNDFGAIASLVGAFATALTFQYMSSWNEYWGGNVIPALLVSATLGVVVSLMTRPDKRSHAEAIELLEIERKAMSDVSDAEVETEREIE
ncbi:sodium:solute symporter family protein [Pirellulaceae bacterium]|jgi:SSS family solute:Na+ symporter|nr:sodium:solute symporter family protein [Pirellulaceae bacterium]